MPAISIILSCYNGERFLQQALNSISQQNFKDWELIFVNDGSTDSSVAIANSFRLKDDRIQIVSKPNRGLNSARNFGLNFISEQSDALIFSDADDVMCEDMLMELYTSLQNKPGAAAAFCNYNLINEDGQSIKRENTSNRFVPTRFWVRALTREENYTPFYSIYTWTPMVEPMTLLKKTFFLKYDIWDEINFPKGEYGESIPLFGEISLNHKIIYVDKPLYQYRKHGNQITSKAIDSKNLQKKIDLIWKLKLLKKPVYKADFKKAFIFRKYRLPLYYFLNGSAKHELRHKPLSAFLKMGKYSLKYLISLPFFLFKEKKGFGNYS